LAPLAVAILLMQAAPETTPPPATKGPTATVEPPEEPMPAWFRFVVDRPGPHKHDRLFLRFAFGLGYLTSSARSAGDRWVLRGSDMPLEFAIGWAPIENLVLFLDATAEVVVPSTMDARFGPTTSSTRAWLTAGGAGLAYYFMPANVHVTASLQRGSLSVDDAAGHLVGATDSGYCATLLVGKEAWTYEQLGIGLGLMVRAARLPDRSLASPDARWTSLSFALVLTNTYN
jgi:hypothetical protein